MNMIHLVELDERGDIAMRNGRPHPTLGTANEAYDETPRKSVNYLLGVLRSEPDASAGGRRLAVVQELTTYHIIERKNFTPPAPVQPC